MSFKKIIFPCIFLAILLLAITWPPFSQAISSNLLPQKNAAPQVKAKKSEVNKKRSTQGSAQSSIEIEVVKKERPLLNNLTPEQKKIKALAEAVIASIKNKDWQSYCDLLSTPSRYNVALNFSPKSKTCPGAFVENKSLRETVSFQSKNLTIENIIPLEEGLSLVTVLIDNQIAVELVALKENSTWKGDLHPPQDIKQYKNIKKAMRSSESPVQKNYINSKTQDEKGRSAQSGGCLPSFLVKPLRRELSVNINQEIASPAVANLDI